MKKYILDCLRRGLIASGFGPLVLAVCYMILDRQGALEEMTIAQVCMGIVSLWALAFVAGGMNFIYQMDRLPLMVAITIHGGVLYIAYLVTYWLNDWLEWGRGPILVFSAIFILGYLGIWLVIYYITKKRTQRINRILEKRGSIFQ